MTATWIVAAFIFVLSVLVMAGLYALLLLAEEGDE